MSRRAPRQRYTIRLADGTVIKIPILLTGAAELGAAIERETAAALLPRSLAVLDGGGTLAFGVFSANRVGLRRRNKLLPWSDIARMDLYHGRLRVFRAGRRRRWAAVPTGKVPNLALLQALVTEIGDRRRTTLSA